MNNDIVSLIKEVLEKLGVSYESVQETTVAGQTLYAITSNESGILIGQRGDSLRALNTLVSHLFEHKTGERVRISIDVNDYKKTQLDKIIAEAHVLATRARELRYDVEMQPANGYERMIVHACLADEADLDTTSVGEGDTRRVVIKWVGN